MTDKSARLQLPFLLPGQAQKEFFHNEALARIDMMLCASLEEGPRAVPPADPIPGQCWIVAEGAVGAWGDQDHALACWTESGWRFAPPINGMRALNREDGLTYDWNGTAWIAGEIRVSKVFVQGKQVVGERRAAIASPSGGATVDAEARATILAICEALKSHGLTD